MPVLSVVSTFNDRGIKAANREIAKLEAVAKRANDKVAAGFFNASRKMNDFAAETGKIGSSMTQNVTLPIVAVGAVAVKMASDVQESLSKTKVVFGDNAASVVKWSETTATALGMSQNEALQAASGYGNLFVTMGLGTGKSAEMSQKLVGLAGDLASFNNANPTDVLEALRAGLTGEAEPLKKFGVNLNEATIKAEALRLGLIKGNVDMVKVKSTQAALALAQQKYNEVMKDGNSTAAEKKVAAAAVARAEQAVGEATKGATGDLTAAQKAQASYSLILGQTKTAQGDFSRTSDGMANQTRIAQAQFKDAGAALGQNLLPMATEAISELNKLVTAFRGLTPEQQKMVIGGAAVAAAAGPVLRVFSLMTSGGAAVAKGIGSISLAMGANASKAPAWAQSLVGGTKAAAGMVKQLALGTAALVKQGALWVADTAKKAANAAATVAHSAAQVAANVATKAWAAGQWLLNAAMSANPIGIIIALIVGLVAGIVVLWQKNEGFRNALIGAWNAIKAAGIAVWNGLVGFIKKFGVAILAIALGPVALAGMLIIKNWDKVKAFLGAVWNGIKTAAANVWNGLLSFFKKWGPWVMAALLGPMGILAKLIIGNWDKIKAGAVTAFTAVVTWVKGVPSKIKAGLGNLANLLSEAGRKIIQGLWDGMKALWEKAKKWVTGIADWIAENKGPLDKDAKLLEPHGQAIMGGLLRGMRGRFGAVQSFIGDVNGALGGIGATPTIGGPALAGAGGSAGGASGGLRPVQFNGPIQIVLPAEAASDPTLAAASGKAAGSAFVEEVARMMRAM